MIFIHHCHGCIYYVHHCALYEGVRKRKKVKEVYDQEQQHGVAQEAQQLFYPELKDVLEVLHRLSLPACRGPLIRT